MPVICHRSECQTTAGCAHKGPMGQTCYFPPRSLSDYSDEEIAREYHNRALRKLGDPRVSVGFAGLPEHHQPFAGRRDGS